MGRRKAAWISFFLVLYMFVGTQSQQQTCNGTDLRALKGFANFNVSSTNCCEWFGIECSFNRVVGLSLPNMGLKGALSTSLLDITHLRTLNLSNNSLSGSVPSGLFRLLELEVLDLSGNELSSGIGSGSFLPSIKVFNVSFNSFTGQHPVLGGATNLTSFDVSFNEFGGRLNTSVCEVSPRVEALRFSGNQLSGAFPTGFGKCGSLRSLFADSNDISGALPEDLYGIPMLEELHLQYNLLSGEISSGIGNLSNLVRLDLSSNRFFGPIPSALGGLRKLEYLCASSNKLDGSLAVSLSHLPVIRVLNFKNNSLSGEIRLNFSRMTRLSSLDLGSNNFTGLVPVDLSLCKELSTLNLAKNKLHGGIPDGFRNLKSLSYLSLSNNSLSNISSAMSTLQHCPNLTTLVLTLNFKGETMPVDGIGEFPNLGLLVIANCGLRGPVPTWLKECKKLQLLDLSWNHLDGSIPSWFGDFESLFYLDLSNNSLAGQIPESLANIRSLSFRYSSQLRSQPAELPFFSKRNRNSTGLQYNQLNSFPPSLILSHNKLAGPIPRQFGNLTKLHVLDLSENNLSGKIHPELSGMSSLEILDLSHNNLTGIIPPSLSKLNFLSKFSVAYNDLEGHIPSGVQFSTFTNSSFVGNAGLCGEHFSPCKDTNFQPQSKRGKNIEIIIGMALGIGCGATLLLALVYFVVSRAHSGRVENTEILVAEIEDCLEASGPALVLLFQNKNTKGITIEDILKSTNNFDQANIIGCGGFGLVYKAILPDGQKVAIKRLSGDFGQMEREFQAEVETLSRAQHQNLVMLQGYCKIGNCRILIYSYMENGSLDYWLHEKQESGSIIDWNTRLRIARGAANGLAYLHQSCHPQILHRDIKSSNILLDENFEAHLADFGLARLIRPYDTHVSTDLVGTLGYIPPEYGQASIATFKGDVYSFGVVLLELLTGRRPMDMCEPKGRRELVMWVVQMKKEGREREVLDPLLDVKHDHKQMLRVLEISCLCLKENPRDRPLIQQIVSWLDDIVVE